MTSLSNAVAGLLPAETAAFYRQALQALTRAEIPFVIGGAYALAQYTGIVRHTKDLDVFVRPADSERALACLAAEGYRTELTFAHWLGKAFHGDDFVDVIFRSGNGICAVDDAWFTHAVAGEVFGEPVRLCPVEEMIWSKGFVQERERYDGADIHHLLLARAQELDWLRLVRRFGRHWRVLLGHLLMFGYVYPTERHHVPAAVLEKLLSRFAGELRDPAAGPRLCQGTLLSRAQYLLDVQEWGYQDPRQLPDNPMTEDALAEWTEAISAQEVGVPEGVTLSPPG